jgi:cysteine-rich repeat protein
LAVAAVLVGCTQRLSSDCAGGGVCPPGRRCIEADHTLFCAPVTCGDGRPDPGEMCDDGNNVSGDGCPADCGPPCGDGRLDPGEVCDDGNNVGGDGCSADCRSTEICGNALIDPRESCDDGNQESHDGCSSQCGVERATWETRDAWPNARADHAMAYDAARGRVVVFGGAVAGGLSGETWEWDGALWRRYDPTTAPPPRADHAMAYDPIRQLTVLFGGGGAGEDSTWLWNGVDWIHQFPHPRPPPQLRGVAMAFDPSLQAVVVFGGLLGTEYQNQTWAWNGFSWQRLMVTASPPPRAWAAMAYDSRRGTLVLFGRTAGGQALDDIWELDGSTWVQRTPPTAPPGRAHAGMAFDAGRGRIVLFGGDGDAGLRDDAWGWDGTQWTMLGAVSGPAARRGLAMTYDVARDRVVVFGGEQLPGGAAAGLSDDLWEWDGGSWRERTVRAQQPSRQSGPGLVYDPLRSKLVLFGGRAAAAGLEVSDTWTWDGRVWMLQPSADQPPPRGDFALATDGTHPVLFGGVHSTGQTSVPMNDTWVLVDSQWVLQTTTLVPPARFGHAMAFDAARGRLVLFGGVLGNGRTAADTWEWDGVQWLARSSLHVPPARAGHAMAYDRGRARVVLFGGSVGAGKPASDDTWEWDGTDWIERTPPTHPPARIHHAMAYDSARARVVLFGGDAGGACADTWLWDGTDWEPQAPAAIPPARSGHAIAFDEARQRVVMFAGTTDAGSPLDDVWEWNGAGWQQATPVTGLPPAREAAAMAYDPIRTTTVLFGGAANNGAGLGDTWVWDGASWRAAASGATPSPRSEHAMTFDTARGRAVLFGGAGAGGNLDDVWEWDGTGWLEATPATRPPARRGHALVYDATRNTTLLIGGIADGASPQRSDQWAWDGARWTDVTPDRVPPWRMDFAVAFDVDRGRVVLFGGRTNSASLADLWEWDGSGWRDRTPVIGASPSARFGHALTYDPARHRVVLVGGQGNSGGLDDVWEWDGTAWTMVSPDAAIAARYGHAMVYDAARKTLLVFGGHDATSGAIRTTSFLHYDEPRSSAEVCETGIDGDGDGKRGCEDPDCRGLCARCGDGVCDAFESCHLCPEDCGVCGVCGDLQCDSGESCASCPGDCGVCDGT